MIQEHRPDYHILSPETGSVVDSCHGPLTDGRCPRIPLGAIVPCAGCALVQVHDGSEGIAYNVQNQMTLCPVTLAASLVVESDADLLPS